MSSQRMSTDLAAWIDRLSSDPELRDRLGANARESVDGATRSSRWPPATRRSTPSGARHRQDAHLSAFPVHGDPTEMCGIAASMCLDRLSPAGALGDSAHAASWTGRRRSRDLASGRPTLEHCRLAVIDPDNREADQPFKDPSGRYTLLYNGELFNYRELRAISRVRVSVSNELRHRSRAQRADPRRTRRGARAFSRDVRVRPLGR